MIIEGGPDGGLENVWRLRVATVAPGLIIGIVLLVAAAVSVVLINGIMRRRGYSIPGKTVVRCSRGHLFSTTWIEGGSLRAIKLGPKTRYQHCPVGKHWAVVHPVKEEDLSEEDRRNLAEASGR
jgi:hypothetical protein